MEMKRPKPDNKYISHHISHWFTFFLRLALHTLFRYSRRFLESRLDGSTRTWRSAGGGNLRGLGGLVDTILRHAGQCASTSNTSLSPSSTSDAGGEGGTAAGTEKLIFLNGESKRIYDVINGAAEADEDGEGGEEGGRGAPGIQRKEHRARGWLAVGKLAFHNPREASDLFYEMDIDGTNCISESDVRSFYRRKRLLGLLAGLIRLQRADQVAGAANDVVQFVVEVAMQAANPSPPKSEGLGSQRAYLSLATERAAAKQCAVTLLTNASLLSMRCGGVTLLRSSVNALAVLDMDRLWANLDPDRDFIMDPLVSGSSSSASSPPSSSASSLLLERRESRATEESINAISHLDTRNGGVDALLELRSCFGDLFDGEDGGILCASHRCMYDSTNDSIGEDGEDAERNECEKCLAAVASSISERVLGKADGNNDRRITRSELFTYLLRNGRIQSTEPRKVGGMKKKRAAAGRGGGGGATGQYKRRQNEMNANRGFSIRRMGDGATITLRKGIDPVESSIALAARTLVPSSSSSSSTSSLQKHDHHAESAKKRNKYFEPSLFSDLAFAMLPDNEALTQRTTAHELTATLIQCVVGGLLTGQSQGVGASGGGYDDGLARVPRVLENMLGEIGEGARLQREVRAAVGGGPGETMSTAQDSKVTNYWSARRALALAVEVEKKKLKEGQNGGGESKNDGKYGSGGVGSGGGGGGGGGAKVQEARAVLARRFNTMVRLLAQAGEKEMIYRWLQDSDQDHSKDPVAFPLDCGLTFAHIEPETYLAVIKLVRECYDVIHIHQAY